MRTIFVTVFLVLTLLLVRACGDNSGHGGRHVGEQTPPLGVEVTLNSGVVRGHEHSESDVWEWLAIPFAQPPTGELRWIAPRQIDAWEGVLETTKQGEPCPQIYGGIFIGDESCLHLNVWRPRTQERELPVYVWIHGGGNLRSSNSLSYLQGDHLAQFSNLVVVSIQHRLGALGWLFYEPLHTGDPLDDSGNFGLLDIIRSLEWIQNNIEAFGGDKDNVTLAGESSGAINIMTLLVSELASGLFHKAIIQSPYPHNPSVDEGRTWSALLYDNLTALIGVSLNEPTEEELATFMRNRSAAELVESYGDIEPYAVTDGIVVPKEGTSLFATGEYVNKVPVIVGTNRDEYKFDIVTKNPFPEVSDDVRNALGRYGSDLWRAKGADQFATEITAAPSQPDVYVYRFNWGSPDEAGHSPLPGDLGRILGACHGSEITFMLGNWEETGNELFTALAVTEENIVGREALSKSIMKYFAAFAYSGNPNGHNLPAWQPFTVDGNFKAIQFDVNTADNSPKITPDYEVLTVDSVVSEL